MARVREEEEEERCGELTSPLFSLYSIKLYSSKS